MNFVFSAANFLFEIFAHAALITGIAVLILRKRKKVDHSAILPFITIPLIPLGLITLYIIGAEAFISWYGENQYETEALKLRFTGPYWLYYIAHLTGVLSTQAFWLPKLRRSAITAFLVGILNLVP